MAYVEPSNNTLKRMVVICSFYSPPNKYCLVLQSQVNTYMNNTKVSHIVTYTVKRQLQSIGNYSVFILVLKKISTGLCLTSCKANNRTVTLSYLTLVSSNKTSCSTFFQSFIQLFDCCESRTKQLQQRTRTIVQQNTLVNTFWKQ